MKTFFKKIVVAVLMWEARAVIKKHKPAIIAITGSVGKTSTKDAAYHILASAGVFVRKSEKSFNSEIGVPLTILGLQNAWNSPSGWLHNMVSGFGQVYPIFGSGEAKDKRGAYPKCLVLEVGADHPGDIESLTKWLHPDVAVITAVSKVPVHVEFFPSASAVLKEKLMLARGIKADGKLVLPAADPNILAVTKEPAEKDATKKGSTQKGKADLAKAPLLTFGVDVPPGSDCNVSASGVEILYKEETGKPIGMSFTLSYKDSAGQIETAKTSIMGVIGVQPVHSMTAAAAAALSFGVKFADVIASIPNYKAPLGRMNIIDGIVGSVIIDDTYNASPDAVKEALGVLGSMRAGRKIAILGDMMELGKFSAEEHRKAGERVVEAFDIGTRLSQDVLVTVGIRARDIGEGAAASGMSRDTVHSFDTSDEAAEFLRNLLHKEGILQGTQDTVILVKGSQSSRMERVSFALLADPSRAKELLVRQDAEWLAKK